MITPSSSWRNSGCGHLCLTTVASRGPARPGMINWRTSKSPMAFKTTPFFILNIVSQTQTQPPPSLRVSLQRQGPFRDPCGPEPFFRMLVYRHQFFQRSRRRRTSSREDRAAVIGVSGAHTVHFVPYISSHTEPGARASTRT